MMKENMVLKPKIILGGIVLVLAIIALLRLFGVAGNPPGESFRRQLRDSSEDGGLYWNAGSDTDARGRGVDEKRDPSRD